MNFLPATLPDCSGWRREGLVALFLLSAGAGSATAAGTNQTQSVADLSLEELVNVNVTSVSKKVEPLNHAAAAVYVLSHDDLRRSGVDTVADALRLVPGVQVAAINSSTWAVSARGFNDQYANKLLVMLDGRTVYSPLFSGVYWDAQQVLLDDVDRIEVIRGPGATVWGANAVNGVVNILSKSARETLGGEIYAGGGDVHQVLGGARYGDQIGDHTFYRVSGTYQRNNDYHLATGEPANDRWDLVKGGFRMDHYPGDDAQLTWQGDVYAGNLADHSGDLNGFNTLGRWTQPLSGRGGYEVQAYLDHTYRNDVLGEVALDTADLTFQHRLGLGERHDLMWGLSYRHTETRALQANSPAVTIVNGNVPLNLFGAFIQDEWQIRPDQLTITLGSKFEHNDFTGLEVQPSVRLVFIPTDHQTIWAAVSQAVRTPSEFEGRQFVGLATGVPVVGPDGGLYVPTYIGNPAVASETLLAYELGYRVQPNARVNLDLAVFYNAYRNIMGRVPSGYLPGVPVGSLAMEPVNSLRGESYGGEVSVTFAPTAAWRLTGSYSLLRLQIHGEPVGDAQALESDAPTHQVTLRSAYDFNRHVSLDAQLRYVDQVLSVAGYVTADVRLSYRPTARLELSVMGQNLLDAHHPEQVSALGAPIIEVPRGCQARITWRF